MNTQTNTFEYTAPETNNDTITTDLVLVLLWSVEEPNRMGEVLRFEDKQSVIIGRGEGSLHDEVPHGAWLRQRPGATERAPPLTGRHLSRRQLHIERQGSVLHVRNVGRGTLIFRGTSVDMCDLVPGDTMLISGVMAMMCSQRERGWDSEPIQDARLKNAPFAGPDVLGLVGESPCAWALRQQVAFLAKRHQHVLILGESGTGKELVAKAIHTFSSRGVKPLVSRNAATIPESLFDAELFGNACNYPNPGMKERPGLVGEANGSSLFLDEIGEIPDALQAHLLRLLDQGGEYHRLGEAQARHSDLRLIAATNKPEGTLKHDFLARFVLRMVLPTLNTHREDIPLLIVHLLRQTAQTDSEVRLRFFQEHEQQLYPRITPRLVEALVRHRYTYHVRELEALLWLALTSCHTGHWLKLTPEVEQRLDLELPSLEKELEVSREELLEVMKQYNGVKEKVWRVLGLKNRYILRRLLQKHNISPEDVGV